MGVYTFCTVLCHNILIGYYTLIKKLFENGIITTNYDRPYIYNASVNEYTRMYKFNKDNVKIL